MKNDSFKDFVVDQLEALPDFDCRGMFGGYGLYSGAAFFGIIYRGALYFKVGSATIEDYRAAGMGPFRPGKKQTLRSFYAVPVEVLEDRARIIEWAQEAIAQSGSSARNQERRRAPEDTSKLRTDRKSDVCQNRRRRLS
jgi:DNA transformation protein